MSEKNFVGLDSFIWWIGVVEDRQDPMKLGRCRVRIFGIHTESLTEIPSEDLPWASVVHSLNSHTFATPKETDVVMGFFADGRNGQVPIIMGIIPGYETNEKNTGSGFHDLRSQDTIKSAPKYPVARTYKTDGTGIHLVEANTANSEVVESLRYPRDEDLNKNTITGLSRGVLRPTDVMQSRQDKPYPIVGTAGDQTFKEPPPAFSPEYPYNQALETESGHSLEFDDTAGSERITLAHRSGSFVEYYPSGTKVEEVVKNNYKIVMSDDHIHIMGHAFVSIDSDVYIRSNGNVFVECGNDLDVKVSGSMNLSVKEALNIKAQKLNVDIASDTEIVSGGNSFLTSGSDVNIKGGGDVAATAGGGVNLSGSSLAASASGDVNIKGGGSVLASAGGTLDISSGGNIDAQAGGVMNLIGNPININSGSASPASGASPAAAASPAGIQDPVSRMPKNENPPSVDGATKFETLAFADDMEVDANVHAQVLQSAGLPPVGTAPVVETGEAAKPDGGGTEKPVVCGKIALLDDYKKVQVSEHFTLADYTQGGSRKLKDQYGYTQAAILCNIVKHAENVLEPLYAAGYRFSLSSGFRRGDEDMPREALATWAAHHNGVPYHGSDHDYGMAADLVSITKGGQSLSAYDAAVGIYKIVGGISKQMLLEYTTSGGPGWVHIAYSTSLPKSAMQFGTLKDHQTYARLQFVKLK